ncbi:MAG TPA: bifunctional methylenetetrahydrofolate dehydrogenase/methenyltetrahydrofolate cyclohydrolase FolD [Alphaproteobacteria bacterium]|nr:bifunctional methylenetetrahydrofolate dehydrogenase/methenyltetrahydrofolate cyclohydrolase FolD [Alphaproteobacteria bacterium]
MTTARIIDGKAFAERLRARIAQLAQHLKSAHGLTPGLGVVLVGDDPASQIYVRNKGLQAIEAGMRSFERKLPADASLADVLAAVRAYNADPSVHGFLVQLPLPKHLPEAEVLAAIDPLKDADGIHLINAGRLASGIDGPAPCTPVGCILLIKEARGPDLSGLDAVVIGRSNIVGKPVAQLLLRENCTVTIAHSRSRDLPAICRSKDIVVAAVGQPELVRGDWIKPGATVIDVGVNRLDAPEKGPGKTRLVGDVCFAEALPVAGAITPVPGGVGPMTIACLLRATLIAACRQAGIAPPEI